MGRVQRGMVGGLLLLGLLIPSGPVAADHPRVVPGQTFDDVPLDHPFAPDVAWLAESGITSGCSATEALFCPDDPVTRAQMAAFLSRALGYSERGSGFTDDDGSVFEPEIEMLAAAGVTRGCNPPANDRFCPDDFITRGQMAVFLVRAFDVVSGPEVPEFEDDNGSPFENAISTLASAGVTRGCGEDRFCPSSPVTRGQMAVFLHRLMGSGRVLPEGLSLSADAEVGEPEVTGSVEVCDEEHGGEVVLHSALRRATTGTPAAGFEAAASELTVGAGDLDLASDAWVVALKPGECARVDAKWDPTIHQLAWPVAEGRVVSAFGTRRHPILGGIRLHSGIDIPGTPGAAIHAAAPGVVTRADRFGGYGNAVDILHEGGLVTRYAHLSRIDVAVGDRVEQGDVVGGMGCTGLCTGTHVHFETREFDDPVDPLRYAGVLDIVVERATWD